MEGVVHRPRVPYKLHFPSTVLTKRLMPQDLSDVVNTECDYKVCFLVSVWSLCDGVYNRGHTMVTFPPVCPLTRAYLCPSLLSPDISRRATMWQLLGGHL